MFRKHYKTRSSNPILIFFRLVLSVIMFAALVGGVYSAYKHFSGLDPLELDPQALFNNLIAARTPKEFKDVLSSIKIDQKISGERENPGNELSSSASANRTDKNPAFRFLLVADSHTDNSDLTKAVNQAKQKYPDLKFIIGLGDYTDVGTIAELKNAKAVFDSSSLRYFLIPGDHDLWDCRNRGLAPASCFKQVFGPNYQTFTFNNFEFLLLDNSDDYSGLGDVQRKWIEGDLEKNKEALPKGIFVFVHEPLYHPSSDHTMGKTEKNLKQQARDLMFQLKSAGVKKVFAGDIHFFSEYSEPVTGLEMATIGAVTIERNPQAPRFAIVSVSEDGKTLVEDVEIK